MKKITVIAVALLSIIPISCHAETPKSIAIIDSGYDSSITQFAGKVSYEVCFTRSTPSCPNGSNFQEGPGSASLNKTQLATGDAVHGTQMLASSLSVNSNSTYVIVRAVSISSKAASWPTDLDTYNILNWLYSNKDKLNLGAVVYSGGRNISTACPTDASTLNLVNNFKLAGIPVVMAAGNNSDYIHVAYPACLTPVIAVGYTDKYGVALSSNSGKDLDFVTNGDITISYLPSSFARVMGSSPAAQIFAASWMAIKQAKPLLSYDQEYALIQSTQTLSSNVYVKNLPTLNLTSALK